MKSSNENAPAVARLFAEPEVSDPLNSASEPTWERTRLSVPRNDSAFLARPDLSGVVDLIKQQSHWLADPKQSLFGRSLTDVRRQARNEILQAARDYSVSILGEKRVALIDLSHTKPLIVTGHQPELFHPGVWVKQIATALLAQQHQGVGLNLVVDNDICESTSIGVPTGSREQPTRTSVSFDALRPEQPWEEAEILDRDLFASFAERVDQSLQPWGLSPLLKEFWPHVLERARHSNKLADCFTAGRMSFEWSQGWGNLELPLSRLCECDSFREFVAYVVSDAVRFREIYNLAVAEYRRVNRIRSRSHPVPDLDASEAWSETPFWIWRQGDQTRGRLFAKAVGNQIWLATQPDEQLIVCRMPSTQSDQSRAIAALQELSARGWKLRTRALTTTLFARLLLGDLFIHGIGGAKYDEITDRLITRFFQLPAPAYLTLSSTAWLPFATPFSDIKDDVCRLRRLIRDAAQNPQRYIADTSLTDVAQLIARRNTLLAEARIRATTASLNQTRHSERRLGFARHQELRNIRRQLANLTATQRTQWEQALAEVEQRLAANRLLKSREFSFCLYPLERVRRMVAELQQLMSKRL